MNNSARQTLIALIAQHGPALSEDPRRVEAFLRDLCGQHKREIFVLVNALKYRVAADLLNSKGVPSELLLARLTQRLEDEMAVNTNAARWAVETWALALGAWGQTNSTRSTVTPITSTRSKSQSRPLQVTTAFESLPRLYPSMLKKIQKIIILSEERVLGNGTEYTVSNVNKLMNAAYAAEVEVTDFRPDVMTVDGMEFCYVPAGPFIMGSDEENDEKPIHKVDIDYDYWLGRYPITVAQWRKFVQEASYVSTEQNNLHESADHPARFIRWQEAVKFCWWLTQLWRQTGYLDHNWIVRLPSEAEWEKAARGGLEIPQMPVIGNLPAFAQNQMLEVQQMETNPLPQRCYPWGDDININRANYSKTGIGFTSAVGRYPTGSSPYGCLEMAGNVWEWTRSLYHEYPYCSADGREDQHFYGGYRTLRGGAFFELERSIRCTCRGWSDLYWVNGLGFRICIVSILYLSLSSFDCVQEMFEPVEL